MSLLLCVGQLKSVKGDIRYAFENDMSPSQQNEESETVSICDPTVATWPSIPFNSIGKIQRVENGSNLH